MTNSAPFPPSIKAVLFDWDNTLVNSWPAITDALNLTRGHYGLETWTVEEARVKSARALRDSFPEWFGDQWEVARDMFYARYHAIHAEKVEPMQGARDLLVFLKEQDVPLAVVSTKKNILLRAEVEGLGWSPFFKAVVGSMDTEKDKPDRQPADLALAGCGLKGGDPSILFVGDTPVDVACACNVGCTPVLINNPRESEGLKSIPSFSDCIELKTALYNQFKNRNKHLDMAGTPACRTPF